MPGLSPPDVMMAIAFLIISTSLLYCGTIFYLCVLITFSILVNRRENVKLFPTFYRRREKGLPESQPLFPEVLGNTD
jgi:hypothetical protein